MFTTFNIFIIWHIHVVVFSDNSHYRNLVHIAAAPDNNGVHKLCCLRNLWIYKSYCSCKVQFFACLLFWNLYNGWQMNILLTNIRYWFYNESVITQACIITKLMKDARFIIYVSFKKHMAHHTSYQFRFQYKKIKDLIILTMWSMKQHFPHFLN